MLSASADQPSEARHHVARIRLLAMDQGQWLDCGLLFDGQASYADHEWTGSAMMDDAGRLSLFYTAVGERGDTSPSYQQRIVNTSAVLDWHNEKPRFVQWTEHRECIRADGLWYAEADQKDGQPGFIRAFRDPFRFVDPTTGREHLVFSATMGQSTNKYCGAIGLATANQNDWQLRPPVITAEGANTELERAHIVHHNNLYYLFWSTQGNTFHPDCPGLNGLYGAVADSVEGHYQPLNGSGLVATNPPQSPGQTYAWEVLDDLSVVSFVDTVTTAGSAQSAFVGGIAPPFALALDGASSHLVLSF